MVFPTACSSLPRLSLYLPLLFSLLLPFPLCAFYIHALSLAPFCCLLSLGDFPLTGIAIALIRMTSRPLLLWTPHPISKWNLQSQAGFLYGMSHCHLTPYTPNSKPISMPSPLRTSSLPVSFCPALFGRLRNLRPSGLVCSAGNHGQPVTTLLYPGTTFLLPIKLSRSVLFSPDYNSLVSRSVSCSNGSQYQGVLST